MAKACGMPQDGERVQSRTGGGGERTKRLALRAAVGARILLRRARKKSGASRRSDIYGALCTSVLRSHETCAIRRPKTPGLTASAAYGCQSTRRTSLAAVDKAASGSGEVEDERGHGVRTYDSRTATMGVPFARRATTVVAIVAAALARPSAVK